MKSFTLLSFFLLFFFSLVPPSPTHPLLAPLPGPETHRCEPRERSRAQGRPVAQPDHAGGRKRERKREETVKSKRFFRLFFSLSAPPPLPPNQLYANTKTPPIPIHNTQFKKQVQTTPSMAVSIANATNGTVNAKLLGLQSLNAKYAGKKAEVSSRDFYYFMYVFVAGTGFLMPLSSPEGRWSKEGRYSCPIIVHMCFSSFTAHVPFFCISLSKKKKKNSGERPAGSQPGLQGSRRVPGAA